MKARGVFETVFLLWRRVSLHKVHWGVLNPVDNPNLTLFPGLSSIIAVRTLIACGVLGSLQIVDKDGNAAGSTFGILGDPNDAPPAVAASPLATAVSSVDPSSPKSPNVGPSAKSAPGNDGADEENGDDDEGEDEQDSEDDGVEGNDPTDYNDNSTSIAVPISSTGTSMVTPSSTSSTSSSTDPSASATQNTPQDPLLPSPQHGGVNLR